jgi:hypothetical protein
MQEKADPVSQVGFFESITILVRKETLLGYTALFDAAVRRNSWPIATPPSSYRWRCRLHGISFNHSAYIKATAVVPNSDFNE